MAMLILELLAWVLVGIIAIATIVVFGAFLLVIIKITIDFWRDE